MKCPVCEVTLSISSREGVEIDFCPQCRGVWLDRGELDKILDRVAAVAPLAPPPAAPAYAPPAPAYEPPRYADRSPEPRDDDRRGYDPRYDKKKRRKSLLDDLFDF